MTVQTPIDPSGIQGTLYGYPIYLGLYTIANLPTTLPAAFGTGSIPAGSMATVTNAAAAPVRGAVPSATGAVVAQVFWNGGAWGF